MIRPRQFASDNYSGMCAEVQDAMLRANLHHAPAYGDDAWTTRARTLMCEVFERDCAVHFVLNGSAANSLILASMCDSFEAVICHEYGHIANDECNAPGFFRQGLHVVTVPETTAPGGKLTAGAVQVAAGGRRDVHASRVAAISVTNATEVGTIYSPAALQELTAAAHAAGLRVHLDGARFSNALATLNVAPKEITWQAGVDAMCFGGTKNGIGIGEAVVIFNPDLAKRFEYRVKQSGQLASKHRFLTAPWVGYLESDVWLCHAGHANAMAQRLRAGLEAWPDIVLPYPTEANAVFARLPRPVVDALWADGWKFYLDVGPRDTARLMCAWDTTPADVDALLADIGARLGGNVR